jgi:hypothetical protein
MMMMMMPEKFEVSEELFRITQKSSRTAWPVRWRHQRSFETSSAIRPATSASYPRTLVSLWNFGLWNYLNPLNISLFQSNILITVANSERDIMRKSVKDDILITETFQLRKLGVLTKINQCKGCGMGRKTTYILPVEKQPYWNSKHYSRLRQSRRKLKAPACSVVADRTSTERDRPQSKGRNVTLPFSDDSGECAQWQTRLCGMESDFPYIVLICSKDCPACSGCPRDETQY